MNRVNILEKRLADNRVHAPPGPGGSGSAAGPAGDGEHWERKTGPVSSPQADDPVFSLSRIVLAEASISRLLHIHKQGTARRKM